MTYGRVQYSDLYEYFLLKKKKKKKKKKHEHERPKDVW